MSKFLHILLLMPMCIMCLSMLLSTMLLCIQLHILSHMYLYILRLPIMKLLDMSL